MTKKDITVWKVLNRDLTSYFEQFQYEKGVLNEAELVLLDPTDVWLAFGGEDTKWLNENYPKWFSYDTEVRREARKDLICIERGFHSALTKKRLSDYNHHNVRIVKCTIPAGSLYYKDTTGCIVSNKIILN